MKQADDRWRSWVPGPRPVQLDPVFQRFLAVLGVSVSGLYPVHTTWKITHLGYEQDMEPGLPIRTLPSPSFTSLDNPSRALVAASQLCPSHQTPNTKQRRAQRLSIGCQMCRMSCRLGIHCTCGRACSQKCVRVVGCCSRVLMRLEDRSGSNSR